ncbi:hypothetical protein PIB30_103907 [Stylosanthes scabra]|uniref:Uncharacterized protein n=1 Tax=Stylosanthes scabra TaxID=79078 RepID=A0ABU6X0R5_9FABA|nr:hypothetical protein [Stylosanthes scabra]
MENLKCLNHDLDLEEQGLAKVPSLIMCSSDIQNPNSSSLQESGETSEGSQAHDPVEFNHQMKLNHSISISMPVPLTCAAPKKNTARVLCRGETETASNAADSKPPLLSKCYSQPVPRDKRFDFFKTWSGKLERQLSIISGRLPMEEEEEPNSLRNIDRPLPVERYLDALEGPELETPRVCD